MLIQPIEAVQVTLKREGAIYHCHLLSLSDIELEVGCSDYLDKDSTVLFSAEYFRGTAQVCEVRFNHVNFTYKLTILDIAFQPGLLIDTRL